MVQDGMRYSRCSCFHYQQASVGQMSTPLGKESLSFFCKSGALFFGVGYGVVKTGWLQRKERKLEAKQEALGSSLPRTLPDTQTHTHTHTHTRVTSSAFGLSDRGKSSNSMKGVQGIQGFGRPPGEHGGSGGLRLWMRGCDCGETGQQICARALCRRLAAGCCFSRMYLWLLG